MMHDSDLIRLGQRSQKMREQNGRMKRLFKTVVLDNSLKCDGLGHAFSRWILEGRRELASENRMNLVQNLPLFFDAITGFNASTHLPGSMFE
jgi:hypothetical protein